MVVLVLFICHEESSRLPTIYTELTVTQVKLVSTPVIVLHVLTLSTVLLKSKSVKLFEIIIKNN